MASNPWIGTVGTEAEATQPLVSVIVVTYNGRHLLDTCLQSIRGQSYRSWEVILVDNGSTDGSVQYVRQRYPGIQIIENGRNLGFAEANNIGIRASHGDYIFALNNDTELDAACLANLARTMQSDPSLGMCATKICNFSRRHIIDAAGIAIYADCSARGRGRLDLDGGQYAAAEEVFGPSGAAGLYRRSMLDEVGLFDDAYFMYCEDTDLAFRARLAGWHCAFVPDARVYHIYSATGGRYSPAKAFLVERNRFWTAVKVLPLPLLVASGGFTALRLLYQAVGALAGVGASGRFVEGQSRLGLLIVLVHAYWVGLRALPRVLHKRRQVQALRRVSSSTVRSWFRRYGITVRELALKD